MTQQEVRNLIGLTVTLWPTVPMRVEVDALMLTSWHLVLADVEFGEAAAAVAEAARRGDAFPLAPGAIAARVLDARDRAAGLAAPDADEAWTELTSAVRARGLAAGPPEWSHPAVATVARALGWRELCMSNNEGVLRAHFLRLYDPAVQRQRSERRAALGTAPLGQLPSHTPALES